MVRISRNNGAARYIGPNGVRPRESRRPPQVHGKWGGACCHWLWASHSSVLHAAPSECGGSSYRLSDSDVMLE
jgi:hypothetical protein